MRKRNKNLHKAKDAKKENGMINKLTKMVENLDAEDLYAEGTPFETDAMSYFNKIRKKVLESKLITEEEDHLLTRLLIEKEADLQKNLEALERELRGDV